MPMRDASVSSSNWRVGSGWMRIGALVILWMMVSCARFCSGPYLNGTSFFVSRVIGAAMMEKSLQNMRWYPAHPRNPLACLRVCNSLGYSRSPAIFAGSTVTPSFEMRMPRKFICGCRKVDLKSFRCNPCSLSIWKRWWIIAMCMSSSMSLLVIPMSSM